MRKLIRSFLVTIGALWLATQVLPSFTYEGGFRTLLLGSLLFMFINIMIVPLIKILLLPINLITLGLFSWVANVVALYFLTVIMPEFKLAPYFFSGFAINGFVIPPIQLNTLYVAIVASFLVGFITQTSKWLSKD